MKLMSKIFKCSGVFFICGWIWTMIYMLTGMMDNPADNK